MHSVRETKPDGSFCVICQIFGILQHSSINQLNYPVMNIVPWLVSFIWYLISFKTIPHCCILNKGVYSIHRTWWSSEPRLISDTYTGIWQQVKRICIWFWSSTTQRLPYEYLVSTQRLLYKYLVSTQRLLYEYLVSTQRLPSEYLVSTQGVLRKHSVNTLQDPANIHLVSSFSYFNFGFLSKLVSLEFTMMFT